MFILLYFALVGDIHTQQFHPFDSFSGVFGQQPPQQPFCLFGYWLLVGELQFCFLEDFDQFGDGGGFEGAEAV